MIVLAKFLSIIFLLISFYGCEIIGEEEDSSNKQMILIGVVEPSNTFLNNKPEGFQLDLIKKGELVDSKFLRRDIQTNSYPFEFAGVYPVGELNLRASYLNQYLEFYLGDISKHQGSFLIGKFPMDKASLATRYLKNLCFYKDIQQLSPKNILDILAYIISIPITQQNNHQDLLLNINKLGLNHSGQLITTDLVFPEWQNHPERYANTNEIQLAEALRYNGIHIPYEKRILDDNHYEINLITQASVSNSSENVTILQVDEESNEVRESNNKISVSESDSRLQLGFRRSITDLIYKQILESKIVIQGQESIQSRYYNENYLSQLNPRKESDNVISIDLIKPSEQVKYATHYSINDSLEGTEYESKYKLKLIFSIMF